MPKVKKQHLGSVRKGKMYYQESPIYHFLKGGNWNDGFSGIGHTGGDEAELEIDNKELIDDSKPFCTYRFVIVKGKAVIVKK